MSKQDVRENENLVTYWRRKLEWYTTEATADEYDEEEVRALRSVLEMVESEEELDETYYNAEKGLQRFRDTLDIRLRIQDEMRRTLAGEVRLANYPEDEDAVEMELETVSEAAGTGKKIAKRRFDFKTNGFRKVAMAASLVVTLVIGGTVGAYAQKEGFFRKVDDKEIIAGSQEGMSVDVLAQAIYENIEEVPFKYLHCLWTPSQIPSDIQIKAIKITDALHVIRTKCEYINESNSKQFITVWKNNCKDPVLITDRLYDGYDFHCSKIYNEIEVSYLVKENDDYTEYIASFDYNNCNYLLSSNCAFDTIDQMIKVSLESNNM